MPAPGKAPKGSARGRKGPQRAGQRGTAAANGRCSPRRGVAGSSRWSFAKRERKPKEVHEFYVAMSELFAMSEASITPSDDFSKELQRRRLLAGPHLS